MAIKRIHVNVQDGENLKELQKEVDFLKELKHTNIVAYYGSEIRGEFLLIYLEYIDMGSIASMLKIYGPFT
jgi:serine/threonine protein kinase